MSTIDEYRRKLSEMAAEHITLLGDIADAEERLNRLKKDIVKSYEQIDNILDLEIKDGRISETNR